MLEWTGNVLPADEEGAFPVEFTAPDTPGVLLTFPAIQVCENGEELAWISGDPADEYPAPRVLVLPAGSEPATTIDDVALDAPGRDQLVAVDRRRQPERDNDDDSGTDHRRGGHDDHGGRHHHRAGRADRHDGGAAGSDRARDVRSSELGSADNGRRRRRRRQRQRGRSDRDRCGRRRGAGRWRRPRRPPTFHLTGPSECRVRGRRTSHTPMARNTRMGRVRS